MDFDEISIQIEGMIDEYVNQNTSFKSLSSFILKLIDKHETLFMEKEYEYSLQILLNIAVPLICSSNTIGENGFTRFPDLFDFDTVF